jgi:hypothetical protein
VEIFNLKKFNAVKGREECCVEVSSRFAAMEDLDAEGEINTAWETARESINKFSQRESRLSKTEEAMVL